MNQMAHIKDIERCCPRCLGAPPRRATHEVFSATNASHGTFCYVHARGLAAELTQREHSAAAATGTVNVQANPTDEKRDC